MREAAGKEIVWSQTFEGQKILDASKTYARRLNAKEVPMPKSAQRGWDSKVGRKRSGIANIHRKSGSTCTRRRA